MANIWDEGRRWFRDVNDLQRDTHSPEVVSMCTDIIQALLWDLFSRYKPKRGDWVLCKNTSPQTASVFQFAAQVDHNSWMGTQFTRHGSDLEKLIQTDVDNELRIQQLQEARVISRSYSGTVLKINPSDPMELEQMRTFPMGRVSDLHFDPKEWSWKQQG